MLFLGLKTRNRVKHIVHLAMNKPLLHCHEFQNILTVSGMHERHFGQSTLSVLGLLREDVTFERVLSLDLTRARKAESLLSTGIGLHFRHRFLFIELLMILISSSSEPAS